ncbi:MAG: cytochrome ubiquinol oxidase subunit I [Gammaproteobacteria bacterium]|nr:cytochrome ubiquinol oxidase subunit I [Gammaproteobacteria bacterium]MCF6259662.1 cytochrome ubiquinol oxidase subunit I [Gammaproteobacteria bacterium]
MLTEVITAESDLVNTLSRIQFGITASYHIIFPSLLIGLSTLLTYLYGKWLQTNNHVYLVSYEFWLKLVAIVYLLAAITGVALSSQIDNVFGGFYQQLESALSPIRQIELILAIVLEGGCIGVMLFYARTQRSYGRFSATILFNIGIFLTALFVISRNSWMNTPAGIEWIDNEIHVLNYIDILFNPSFPLRYLHMIVAGLMATSFVVMGIAAFRLLKYNHDIVAIKSFNIGFKSALVFTICQFIIGDLHGLNVYKHQPLKIASMEGHWETKKGSDFILWANPSEENELNHHEIKIPYALSIILTHEINGEVLGIKEMPKNERPNISLAFYTFRIMLALSLLMLAMVLIGVIKSKSNPLHQQKWFLRIALFMSPSGLIAIIAGWIVAEVSRQPWVVYGMIKTSQTISAHSAEQIITSMITFSLLYLLLSIAAIIFVGKVILNGNVQTKYRIGSD